MLRNLPLLIILKAWRKKLDAPVEFEENPQYDPEFELKKMEKVLAK